MFMYTQLTCVVEAQKANDSSLSSLISFAQIAGRKEEENDDDDTKVTEEGI